MIFLSYNHSNQDSALKIRDIFLKKLGNKYKIDIDTLLGYKDSIKGFMESIPQYNYVIMLVSDAYLKSPYCMYEVLETMRNHDYKERMLFIIFDDANIYNNGMSYQTFWHSKLQEYDKEIKAAQDISNFPLLQYILKEREICYRISSDIVEFINTLKDEKGINYKDLLDHEFEEVIKYILNRDNGKKGVPD